MFSKNFGADSFIYKFLAWPGEYLYTRPKDICQLRTWFLLKLLGLIVGTLAFGTYVASIASFLLWKFSCGSKVLACTYGYNDFVQCGEAALNVSLGIVTVVILSIAVIKGLAYYDNWARESGWKHKRITFFAEDNSLKVMYRSWKDKVCYPVTFKAEPTFPFKDADAVQSNTWENWDDVTPSNEIEPTASPV